MASNRKSTFMIDQLIRMDGNPRHGINSSALSLESPNPDLIPPRAKRPSLEMVAPIKQEIDTDFPDGMIECGSHSCTLLQSNPNHSPSSNQEHSGEVDPDDNRCLGDSTGAENIAPFYPFLPLTDLALAGIECRLVTRDLWCRFNKLGTEMIITKSGRRMFPNIKICFIARLPIHPLFNFLVGMDIAPVDSRRYRYAYHRSSWQVAGRADTPPPRGFYIHPDSPFTVEQLFRQTITFEKLKLTNNAADKSGHIILNSMHKYQPRIHLLGTPVSHCLHTNKDSIDTNLDTKLELPEDKYESIWKQNKCFVFPETSFIAVTAYQNQLITKLKIDTNPFAKGFRDSTRLPDASKSFSNTVTANPEQGLQSLRTVVQGRDQFPLNFAQNFFMFSQSVFSQLKCAPKLLQSPHDWAMNYALIHHQSLIAPLLNHRYNYHDPQEQSVQKRNRRNS